MAERLGACSLTAWAGVDQKAPRAGARPGLWLVTLGFSGWWHQLNLIRARSSVGRTLMG